MGFEHLFKESFIKEKPGIQPGFSILTDLDQ
jgi:hypothetical protein